MNVTNIERLVEQGVRTMISRKVGDLTCRIAKNYMFYGADKVRKFGLNLFPVTGPVQNYTRRPYESR